MTTTEPGTTMTAEQMQEALIALHRWAQGAHALLTTMSDGRVRYPLTPPPPQPPRFEDGVALKQFLEAKRPTTVVTVEVLDGDTVRNYDVSPPSPLPA